MNNAEMSDLDLYYAVVEEVKAEKAVKNKIQNTARMAVDQNSFENVPTEEMTDELIDYTIKNYPLMLEFLPEEYRTDKRIVMALSGGHGTHFMRLVMDMKDVITADHLKKAARVTNLRDIWSPKENFSQEEIKDKFTSEILVEALKADGLSREDVACIIRYFPKESYCDEAFAAAFAVDPSVIYYDVIPNKYKTNGDSYKRFLDAVTKSDRIRDLSFIPKEHRTEEMCLAVFNHKHTTDSLKLIPDNLLKDDDFISKLIKTDYFIESLLSAREFSFFGTDVSKAIVNKAIMQLEESVRNRDRDASPWEKAEIAGQVISAFSEIIPSDKIIKIIVFIKTLESVHGIGDGLLASLYDSLSREIRERPEIIEAVVTNYKDGIRFIHPKFATAEMVGKAIRVWGSDIIKDSSARFLQHAEELQLEKDGNQRKFKGAVVIPENKKEPRI